MVRFDFIGSSTEDVRRSKRRKRKAGEMESDCHRGWNLAQMPRGRAALRRSPDRKLAGEAMRATGLGENIASLVLLRMGGPAGPPYLAHGVRHASRAA